MSDKEVCAGCGREEATHWAAIGFAPGDIVYPVGPVCAARLRYEQAWFGNGGFLVRISEIEKK